MALIFASIGLRFQKGDCRLRAKGLIAITLWRGTSTYMPFAFNQAGADKGRAGAGGELKGTRALGSMPRQTRTMQPQPLQAPCALERSHNTPTGHGEAFNSISELANTHVEYCVVLS